MKQYTMTNEELQTAILKTQEFITALYVFAIADTKEVDPESLIGELILFNIDKSKALADIQLERAKESYNIDLDQVIKCPECGSTNLIASFEDSYTCAACGHEFTG